MKISRPSPSMVVAGMALFVSLGGTSIAAVNYAVAGGGGGRQERRLGELVAGARRRPARAPRAKSGTNKGRLPGKFVAGVPKTTTFNQLIDVNDNVVGAPQTVATLSGLGTLTSTCNDQNAAAGIEDPTSTVTFINTSGEHAQHRPAGRRGRRGRSARRGQPDGGRRSPSTARTRSRSTSSAAGLNALIEGVVQQNNPRTAAATCAIYGVSMQTPGR